MTRYTHLLLLVSLWLAGCASQTTPPTPTTTLPATTTPEPTPTPPVEHPTPTGQLISSPTATPPPDVPITNDAGEVIDTRDAPHWVLVSGVDEHGLIAEEVVTLLAETDPAADASGAIHTGAPALVQEIRQTGPQGLRWFFWVEGVDGEAGWVSDYYIRRVVYLFNIEGTEVPVYAIPNGPVLTVLPNVSPATLLDPTRPDWWQVATPDGMLSGWVSAEHVKESPEEEFLINTDHSPTDHSH